MNHNRSTIFFLEARKNCRKGDVQGWTVWVLGFHMTGGLPADQEPWGLSGDPGPIPSPWPGVGQPHPQASLWVLQPAGMGARGSMPHHGGTRVGCRDLSSLSELRVKDLLWGCKSALSWHLFQTLLWPLCVLRKIFLQCRVSFSVALLERHLL